MEWPTPTWVDTMKNTTQFRREIEARREKRERNNSDIRPWVSIGEAAELALSKMLSDKKKADSK